MLGTAVAFEVDGYDAAAGDAWSVVLKGRAREIEAIHEVFDALDLPLFPWHASPKHRFVRIVPDELSWTALHTSSTGPPPSWSPLAARASTSAARALSWGPSPTRTGRSALAQWTGRHPYRRRRPPTRR